MQPTGRLVLIETSSALPGLLPFAAHEALREAGVVLARDPQQHPAAPHLQMAGLSLVAATPGAQRQAPRDLLSLGGDASDTRLAQGILDAAAGTTVAYLLGPDEEAFSRTIAMEAARQGDTEVEFVWLVGAPEGLELLRLVEIMAALRDPKSGCPWDLEQDHSTLKRHLIEEAYELLEAIDAEDDTHIAEELGDVLLQVMFHAQVARDRGAFTIDEVAAGIADKLVRRHPHVFGDGEASTADEVQQNWDQLKAAEKTDRTGPFDGIPRALPALVLATEQQKRAGKLGFAWPDIDSVVAKVHEELGEVLEAVGDQDRVGEELGDLLQAVVALARQLGVDPEEALRQGSASFRDRFGALLSRVRSRDLEPQELTIEQWLEFWDEVKAAGW